MSLSRACARSRSLAKSAKMGLNIDAEEADRLSLSLDVIETVLSEPALAGWDGFGVVVQAYGQRAGHDVLDYLNDLATRLDRKLMVRLVKGAYWDTEIKPRRLKASTASRSSPRNRPPTSAISPMRANFCR